MSNENLEPEVVSELQNALSILSDIADRDCYCEKPTSSPCDTCVARRAQEKIQKAMEGSIESYSPRRMTNPAERIFVEQFRKECERRTWLNGGRGLLDIILTPEKYYEGSRSGAPTYIPPYTNRDAKVATSVIQWLGTNCGQGFLHECEQQIEKARASRREWGVDWISYKNTQEHRGSELMQAARAVAEDTISVDSNSFAVNWLTERIMSIALSYHKKQLQKIMHPAGEEEIKK